MLTVAVVLSGFKEEAAATGPPTENRFAPNFPDRSKPEFCCAFADWFNAMAI